MIRLNRRRTGVLGVFIVAGTLAVVAACAGGGQSYSSPDEAVSALVSSVRSHDKEQVRTILGPGSEEMLDTGDDVASANARKEFLTAYDRKHSIVTADDGKATLVVGEDDWPLPIPIVKKDNGWQFDTKAGKQEVIARRVGENELFAIEVCRAVVDAQKEYAATDPAKTGQRAYAQKFLSTPGKRDGLYYETKPGEPESPLGPLVAGASAEGYKAGSEPQPFHGYRYRILTAQGPDARGGEADYLKNGLMTGGFAVIAWPASYDNSGVMTFIVSHAGIVYQQDLGSNTEREAAAITDFNPDDGWSVVP